eukprot:159200_1
MSTLPMLIAAMVILLLCFLLHFIHHCHLKLANKLQNNGAISVVVTSKSELYASDSHINTVKIESKSDCRCCYVAILSDINDFHLFPQLFLFYVAFIAFLCCMIIIKMCGLLHNSTDFIIYIGILLLCIFESFFSFYRHSKIFSQFTDNTNNIMLPTIKFIVFIIIFTILYIFQIYFIYWLWPILCALYLTINIFYTIKVSSNSIYNYKNNSNSHSALPSIYFVRKISMIFYSIQSAYFATFLILYSTNHSIIYYLPLFWTISCMLFSMNFTKNRNFIKHKILRLKPILPVTLNPKLPVSSGSNVSIQQTQQRKKSKQLKIVVENNDLNPSHLQTNTTSVTNTAATYHDEEKEIVRESVLFGLDKYYSNQDGSGLSILNRLKLNITQSLSKSYITMNESEKLDINEIDYCPEITHSASFNPQKSNGLIKKQLNLFECHSSPVVAQNKDEQDTVETPMLTPMLDTYTTYTPSENVQNIRSLSMNYLTVSDMIVENNNKYKVENEQHEEEEIEICEGDDTVQCVDNVIDGIDTKSPDVNIEMIRHLSDIQ